MQWLAWSSGVWAGLTFLEDCHNTCPLYFRGLYWHNLLKTLTTLCKALARGNLRIAEIGTKVYERRRRRKEMKPEVLTTKQAAFIMNIGEDRARHMLLSRGVHPVSLPRKVVRGILYLALWKRSRAVWL